MEAPLHQIRLLHLLLRMPPRTAHLCSKVLFNSLTSLHIGERELSSNCGER